MARQTKPAPEPAAPTAPSNSDWKLEAVLVFLVVIAGFGLRLAYPSRMAVEHFDEGVYSSNRWFSDGHGNQYPNRHLYAPPLLPWLIEWSFVLFGPSNFAAMLPSLVAGCLTIPLVWWILRGWMSARTALAAAILIAGSSLHIAFSRAALTDALLLFWMAAAVGAGARAFHDRSWAWAIVSGILGGLAWWTKYNGWLALAVLGSGGAAWALFPGRPLAVGVDPNTQKPAAEPAGRPDESRWKRVVITAGLWLLIATVACATWAPCWWSLQERGGYAAVAANHRGYFVGPDGWKDSFWQQNINLYSFNGWMSVVSMAFAVIVPSFLKGRGLTGFTWNSRDFFLRLCLMSLLAALMIVPGIALIVFAGIELFHWVVLSQTGRVVNWTTGIALGSWLLAAWFSGLLLATPMYTPYARLILPLWLAGVAGLSVASARLTGVCQILVALQSGTLPPSLDLIKKASEKSPRTVIWQKVWMVLVYFVGAVSLIAIAIAIPYLNEVGTPGWEDRTTCQTISRQAIADILADMKLPPSAPRYEFAVYTYGEPALMFQMRLEGAELTVPVEHLRFAKPGEPLRVATYVFIGPHAWRTHGFAAQLAEAVPRLQLVGRYHLDSSLLVRTDDQAEAGNRRVTKDTTPPGSTESTMLLYRVLPP